MAENDAEQKAGGGLVKKLAIFGGGGLLLIVIGLGAGYLIFGSSQPDPSEEIEEIIERKMQEREAAEVEADNATPSKQSKDTPGGRGLRDHLSRIPRHLHNQPGRIAQDAAGRSRCFHAI